MMLLLLLIVVDVVCCCCKMWLAFNAVRCNSSLLPAVVRRGCLCVVGVVSCCLVSLRRLVFAV